MNRRRLTVGVVLAALLLLTTWALAADPEVLPASVTAGGGSPERGAPEEGVLPTPEGSLPALLVAGEAGVSLWSDGEGAHALLSEPVAVAYDDRSGGIVYQPELPPEPAEVPGIYRRRAGAATSELVVAGAPGVAVGLVGLTDLAGGPAVLYTKLEFPCGPPWAEQGMESLPVCDQRLLLRSLVSGEEIDLGWVGGWESAAAGPVSVGGGRVAAVVGYYLDDDVLLCDLGGGEECFIPLSLPVEDPPAGYEWEMRFHHVAISPDGDRLAYAEDVGYWTWREEEGRGSRIAHRRVVVVDLRSMEEVVRVELPGEGTDWIDFDGERVVVSSGVWGVDGRFRPGPALLVDLDGSVTELPVVGRGTLWRSALP